MLKVLAEIGKVTKELRASSFENVESAKKAVEAKVKSFPERVDKVIEKCRKVSGFLLFFFAAAEKYGISLVFHVP